MDRFHCFYTDPAFREPKHVSHDQLQPVLDLVKENAKEHSGNVRGLKVIWGEELEFEPCEVVQTYRVKEK